jgi:hypothetical protein
MHAVAFQPQSGSVLQPRVAAAATLGKRQIIKINRNAVALFASEEFHQPGATALRLQE